MLPWYVNSYPYVSYDFDLQFQKYSNMIIYLQIEKLIYEFIINITIINNGFKTGINEMKIMSNHKK